jgi:SAM-dependent methyltransferase
VRWLAKAAVQKTLSGVPAGDRLNYLFQTRVTRTLPAGEAQFRRKVARAVHHFEAFRAHGRAVEPREAVLYEFGAGWDLAVPLTYAALGVGRQLLVDIRPNLRVELVNDSLAKLARLREELERETGHELRPLGAPDVASATDLERRFGIEYRAPCDARATGLPAASVDFASSTNTLEHVPEAEIAAILAETRRLLRPEGVLSCRINMRDHASYSDPAVGPYLFLTLPARRWRLVNSRLGYQNRLRYPDYARLLAEAGFEVVAEEVARPSAEELERLAALPLAPEFEGRYSLDDLRAKSLAVVVRPPPDGAPRIAAWTSASSSS